ncbi:MAG: aminotransferase class V-fold PLP-dependent enzyme [Acidobacteria bacterium]|nr:aminotransferase class V-fold PLP-dependent enzyme [Acidobacteriota bacterium]
MAVYLDCAATTPIDPRVYEEVTRHLAVEFGNAGSRTHDYGLRARRAVEKARQQVAAVVSASRGEVIFTSGATESNNLAILGLAEQGERTGRKHIVSTEIEHHAVLACTPPRTTGSWRRSPPCGALASPSSRRGCWAIL